MKVDISPERASDFSAVEQLVAERDYWEACVRSAAGFASAKAADDFRKACESWIERRKRELLRVD